MQRTTQQQQQEHISTLFVVLASAHCCVWRPKKVVVGAFFSVHLPSSLFARA